MPGFSRYSGVRRTAAWCILGLLAGILAGILLARHNVAQIGGGPQMVKIDSSWYWCTPLGQGVDACSAAPNLGGGQ
jgi:hypothetical protein